MSQTIQLAADLSSNLDRDRIEINKSGLFNSQFYLSRYQDILADNVDPLLHFLEIGHSHGFNPHPLFDIAYYRKQAGNHIKDQNPLLHFLQNGNRLELSP